MLHPLCKLSPLVVAFFLLTLRPFSGRRVDAVALRAVSPPRFVIRSRPPPLFIYKVGAVFFLYGLFYRAIHSGHFVYVPCTAVPCSRFAAWLAFSPHRSYAARSLSEAHWASFTLKIPKGNGKRRPLSESKTKWQKTDGAIARRYKQGWLLRQKSTRSE